MDAVADSFVRTSSLRHRLTLIIEFARSSFLIMLAHRVRYVMGVLNYMVYVAVNYYLWEALYAVEPDKEKASWTLAQMQTYVIVNWVVRSAYFSNSDNILAARINKGEITSDLMRPSSLLLQFYGSALGEAVFRALFMAAPVLALAIVVFNIQLPASPLHTWLFIYSIILAFHIFFAVNFLTGLCAVYTEKLQGFLWAKFMLLQFLSGLLLPLEFFPEVIRPVFKALPFIGMAYTPMSIYLGRLEGNDLWWAVAQQTGWTITLMFFCELFWRRCRHRLSVLGG